MMSLFGSIMGDVEEDPFFGSHMTQMRQMNNMMNSLFSDPFGMLGGMGPLAITGPMNMHISSLTPSMPQMPSLNRLFPGSLMSVDGHTNTGSSFSSRTVVISHSPNGKQQVFSSSSSTKIGPNGVKETRKTLQDSRTGTKKMSIGHHIGERAHLIEREQNYYSGEAEERQEFINIEEEDAEDFETEFQTKAGASQMPSRAAIAPARRSPPQLALPAPPPQSSRSTRPRSRRPLRVSANPLAAPTSSGAPDHSPSVRNVYGGPHPQTHRHGKHHKPSAHRPPSHGN